ncbi:hypothetical protein DPMN_166934 [Dreissena polymorpha]|uniref:Uncharacterized protein n=1 Tax=Dreissena polymorpha TaxID=45954 RepID=A0A9D4F2C2_DREPO|nr:hypothetical protein DPMN_166934 [Dreissena polymorpha]
MECWVCMSFGHKLCHFVHDQIAVSLTTYQAAGLTCNIKELAQIFVDQTARGVLLDGAARRAFEKALCQHGPVGAMWDAFHQHLHTHVLQSMSRVLRKLGLMLVRKVLSQISLCALLRLIRDDTFRFNGIFRLKEVSFYQKSSLSEKCRP